MSGIYQFVQSIIKNNFVVEDFIIDNQSDAVVIRELCESRVSCDHGSFHRAELNIQFLSNKNNLIFNVTMFIDYTQ